MIQLCICIFREGTQVRQVFIISEFNPFHYGHEYLLQRAKAMFPKSKLICVMGGNFCQRGEVCVADKYARANCAVSCGADLVILLPTVYSSACGRQFAKGAIGICNAFAKDGDVLFFGSECGDTDTLRQAVRRLDGLDIDVSRSPDEPTASLRSRLYREKYGDDSVIRTSNNILGMEYLRAIDETRSPLAPMTVKRIGTFASASEIRAMPDGILPHVPSVCRQILSECDIGACMRYGERYILGKLREISDCTDISECGGGLGNRILSASHISQTYEELIENCKTKKYPTSRIHRAVLALLLGITELERESEPTFTVLLSGRRDAMHLLDTDKIDVITKPARASGKRFERECDFDRLYSLLTPQILQREFYLKKSAIIHTSEKQ